MRILRSFVTTALTGFLGAALLSCTSSTNISDPTTGTIDGIVKDEAGTPVRGVKVRFINTTQISDVVSDSMGMFLIRDVTVGTYDMNVYTPANYVLAPSQPATT